MAIKYREIVYSVHKILFCGHYKKLTSLLVPDLFKLDKLKLGKDGDGTYILPKGLIDDKNVLISLGIADDISFEEDYIKTFPNTIVYAFDPTIENLPHENSRIIFYRKGIAGRKSKAKSFITFDNIIEDNKIEEEKPIIIKMDIEGWEWGVLDKLNFDNYNIPVMTIEFHMMTLNSISEWLLFPYYFWKRIAILKKTLKNYYIFHIHANNFRYSIFKEFSFPWLFEITLIKKELFYNEIIKDINTLNSTNFEERKDIQFPFFHKK